MNDEHNLLIQFEDTIKLKNKFKFSSIRIVGIVVILIILKIIPFTTEQFVLIFGMFVVAISIYLFVVQFRTLFWNKTSCKVLKKDIIPNGHSTFFPAVYYIYTVNDQKYISNKINYDLFGKSKVRKANIDMKAFIEGSIYDCFYNPRDHAQAVLFNKPLYYPILLFCLGIIFISISVV